MTLEFSHAHLATHRPGRKRGSTALTFTAPRWESLGR